MPADLSIHHVCGVDELRRAPLASADRIVSILDPYDPVPEELRSIEVPVLTLRFEDIIERNAPSAPRLEHVRQLLAFDAAAGSDERLVVHCTAGISRSTASLAVLLAARHPELSDEIFAAIRELRPTAWPNSLIVEYGDLILERGGALLAALRRHYQIQVRHPVFGGMFRSTAPWAKIPGEASPEPDLS